MQTLTSPDGIVVSYDRYGQGAPLVLVHGAFSDHATNWEFVRPLLEDHFTMYAIARRGRGATDTTRSHTLLDESRDAVALLRSIPEPVFLLGHSYGGHVALAAAAQAPERIRKLVCYEAAWPRIVTSEALAPLEVLADAGDWDGFAFTFFRDLLSVPLDELDAVRASELWPPIVADAEASLGDLRAISAYDFQAKRFRSLPMPVLLQIGSESPRDLYVTDALAAVLPEFRIDVLQGQAHEGMTTAPEQYAESVLRFCVD